MARPSADFEVVPVASWSVVRPEMMQRWEQGQHCVILGKSGRGKSTLMLDLIDGRCEERGASICAIGTKPRDDTLFNTGWPIFREWPPDYAARVGRRMSLWPKYGTASTARASMRPHLVRAFDEMIEEGGWTIGVDELSRLGEQMGLNTLLNEVWQGARSSRITLVGATQRPAWISRSSLSEVYWCASLYLSDHEDRTRAAEVMGDRHRWADHIKSLRGHQFLMVDVVNQRGVISEVGT